MSSQTIVIHSHDPENKPKAIIQGTKCYITYTLADTLKFEEPHCARLLWVYGGVSPVFLIFADFVKRQNVDGVLLPYLGRKDHISGWVPLASNHIPQTGIITVLKSRGETGIGNKTKFTIAIQIAPEALIYGTQS